MRDSYAIVICPGCNKEKRKIFITNKGICTVCKRDYHRKELENSLPKIPSGKKIGRPKKIYTPEEFREKELKKKEFMLARMQKEFTRPEVDFLSAKYAKKGYTYSGVQSKISSLKQEVRSNHNKALRGWK